MGKFYSSLMKNRTTVTGTLDNVLRTDFNQYSSSVGNIGISCVIPPLKNWAAQKSFEQDMTQFFEKNKLDLFLILTGPFVDETSQQMQTVLLIVAQKTPVLSEILNDVIEKLNFQPYLQPIEDEYYIEFLVCNGTFSRQKLLPTLDKWNIKLDKPAIPLHPMVQRSSSYSNMTKIEQPVVSAPTPVISKIIQVEKPESNGPEPVVVEVETSNSTLRNIVLQEMKQEENTQMEIFRFILILIMIFCVADFIATAVGLEDRD